MKYVLSLLILAFLVTVNVTVLLTQYDNPCVYEVCPDYGSGGAGLFDYVVDRTPPNFYVPAGQFCGIACFDYPTHINWSLFTFDLIAWLIITALIFLIPKWMTKRQLK